MPAKNHRKKTPNLNASALIVLAVALMIICVGGIFFVIVKNEQITLRKEIERSQRRMDDHRVAITEHQADIDETLGVFRLRQYLATSGSDLEPIPAGWIQRYQETRSAPNDAVASR